MSQIILAYDLGTTGTKVSAYDENGVLLGSKYHTYKTYYPGPDQVEQNPSDWWEAICVSTKRILSEAGIEKRDVAGIAFSGQMMAQLPVSKDGEVLTNRAIIWADSRSVEEAAFIDRNLGGERFYDITGGGMPIPLYGVAKILYIKNHFPDLYAKTYKFMSVKDMIIRRLTGSFLTEYSDASNIGLLDLETLKWSDEIIHAAGIDREKLVDTIAPSTTVAGRITGEAAEQIGLLAGTPVVCGGGDVPCAALGAGIVEEGNAYNCLGSASWFAVAARKPLIDYNSRPFNILHVVPGMCVSQMATFSAGSAHEWIAGNLCDLEAVEAKRLNKSVYALYDEKVAKVPAGSNGVIFMPNMRPGGAPHNNLDDRGAFVGLMLSSTKDDMLRAVLEGISFNIRLMCEDIEKKTGLTFKDVGFIGGGARSDVWGAIQASVMNRNFCSRMFQQEANSFGAAMVAGVTLGIFSDFSSAVEKFVKVGKVYRPDPKDVQLYEELYPIYKDVYGALSPINTRLKRFYLNGNSVNEGRSKQ